jgi:hypothetical protein
MEQLITGVGGINANLAPDAFRRWAQHYFACAEAFVPPHRFSPVPYFLLCRAIELSLKARHLRGQTQDYVKKEFGHNLSKCYAELPASERTLAPERVLLLVSANDIYSGKGFEYFEPEDALTGYRRYPNLTALKSLAEELLQ